MPNPESRLQELGLTLPAPPAAAGAYVPAVRTGNLLYLAGTLPMRDGKIVSLGKVGREIDLGQAAEAAKLCTLNALANAKAALGSLDKITRVVMVNGFVNGIDGFSDSPKVLNGASEFLLQIFGESGKHARAAVSVNGLPLGASVEVQIVLEVRD
ncbi:MAG: RidA family protein [Verrucomicrobia bacterium]|jgi:enamine deaminase RidA (YjgF/YER057c/UK114 family)|nr:RidA family protein [Verrucomicrobiota bacterium]TSA36637.1 MAG: RidA family protein [Opitutales bacterium]